MSIQTPRDLAIYTFSRLGKSDNRPTVEVLESLFEIVFFASLKTEEHSLIRCSIALIKSNEPDPDPPARIRDHRWTFCPIATPIALTVANLAKLALATDSATSTLAVAADKLGNLSICGIFDQQGGLHAWLRHERDSFFDPPGILQAQAFSVGHVVVTNGTEVIAELNGGVLIENSVDVMVDGTIENRLRWGLVRRMSRITERVRVEGYELDVEENGPRCWDTWMKIVKRLLLRARDYGHGGAFLITDASVGKDVSIRFPFEYDRIPVLFENPALCS